MEKNFSPSEKLAVEYLAPDLTIVCRQCYYCSSDYLPNKGFVLTFFLLDDPVDNVSD